MWTHSFRFCMFLLVYQTVFDYSSSNLLGETFDYDLFVESIKSEYKDFFVEQLDSEANISKFFDKSETKFRQKIKFLKKNYPTFKETLEGELAAWDKTFDIIKAVLFCFMIEQNDSKNSETFQRTSIGIYIQLCEEFVVSANVKLIHAVLAKVLINAPKS